MGGLYTFKELQNVLTLYVRGNTKCTKLTCEWKYKMHGPCVHAFLIRNRFIRNLKTDEKTE